MVYKRPDRGIERRIKMKKYFKVIYRINGKDLFTISLKARSPEHAIFRVNAILNKELEWYEYPTILEVI